MSRGKSQNPEVEAVFLEYPPRMRKRLMKLRQLILDTARRTDGVGKVEEALRWGMPSYLTPQTKSGTTLRIHWTEKDPDRYAVYFHCQTSLVSTFRRLYPTQLTYDGNRAIVFHHDDEPPIPELRRCISLALTYHLDKQGRRSGPAGKRPSSDSMTSAYRVLATRRIRPRAQPGWGRPDYGGVSGR